MRIRVRHFPPTFVSLLMMCNGIMNIVFAMLPVFNLHGASDLTHVSSFVQMIPAQKANTLLTVVVGLILIAVGLGVYRRKRSAWWWALILTALLTFGSVYPVLKLKTLVLAVLSLVTLLLFHRSFSIRSKTLQTDHVIAWATVIFALGYGAIGSYLLRAQFHDLHTFVDAIYFTLVTYSTVGYGDITPATMDAKIFVSTMILVGLGAFITAVTVLIGPMIEGRIKGVFKMVNRLGSVRKHTVICGFNSLTSHLAKELLAKKEQVLFIEPSNDLAQSAKNQGFDVIVGDPTNEDILSQANVKHANHLICAQIDDAQNVLTTMTVAELKARSNKSVPHIMARIDTLEHVAKAKQAGADEVISPAVLGAKLISDVIFKNQKVTV